MKIIFFGTSDFGIPAFRRLLASNHEVLALVTQPDRKKGRSLKVLPPPMKIEAAKGKIPVLQPENASAPELIESLRKFEADLFVVISFGQILKTSVLSLPKLFCVNLHASLLPKYRGAAPTNWAIVNGESVTGVTIIKMNERMDEGDIILKKETGVEPQDDNLTLSKKLSSLGAGALLSAIDMIEKDNNIKLTKQDNAYVTYAPKLKKSDGLIDWKESALCISNKIKGFIPWPGAYTHYDGKVLKMLSSEVSSAPSMGGQDCGEVIDVIKETGILTKTGSGNLLIKHLQLEGKKAMDASSFIRGHKISPGCKFE